MRSGGQGVLRRLASTLAGGWNDAAPAARRLMAPIRRAVSGMRHR